MQCMHARNWLTNTPAIVVSVHSMHIGLVRSIDNRSFIAIAIAAGVRTDDLTTARPPEHDQSITRLTFSSVRRVQSLNHFRFSNCPHIILFPVHF